MSKKTWRAIDGNPNNTGFRIFEGDQYIGFIGDSDQKTDAKANAQLIAAAPELLGALKEIMSGRSMDSDLREQCKSAIAKALGDV